MAISLADNFSYSGAKPNFERDSYATLADMVSVNENFLPDVFIGVCNETGKAYLFNKSNEVDPTLGKWREIVGGTDVTDYIRNTDDLSTFVPMVNGEIVEYIGTTTQDYTQGYFYKVTENITYTDASGILVGSNLSNLEVDVDVFVNSGVSLNEDHIIHYSVEQESWLDADNNPVDLEAWGVSVEGEVEDNDSMNIRVNSTTTYPATRVDVQPDQTFTLNQKTLPQVGKNVDLPVVEQRTSLTLYSTEEHDAHLGEIVQYIGNTYESNGLYHGYFYQWTHEQIGEHAGVYYWKQWNVQPGTTVIDNVTTQSSTEALSANMGYELNQRIDNIESRGRYLSNWNCQTKKPETDPLVLPYILREGDYYIVSSAVKAEPESCTMTITEGSTFDSQFQQNTYKQKVGTDADRLDYFAYTTMRSMPSMVYGNEKVVLRNQSKFSEIWSQLVEIANNDPGRQSGTPDLVSVTKLQFRWFYFSGTLYRAVEIFGLDENGTEYQIYSNTLNGNINGQFTYTEQQDLISEWLLESFGLGCINDIYVPQTVMEQETWHAVELSNSSDLKWTMNGSELPEGDTISSYGVVPVMVQPVLGDSFTIVYRTLKQNFRPEIEIVTIEGEQKKCYNGHESTVVETEEVHVNDTYLFDGNSWILLSNTQKEVSFAALAGNPYDNVELANALDAKVDDVQVKGAGDSDYRTVVTDKVAKIDLVSQGVDYTFDAVPSVTSVKDALDDLMNRQYYKEPSFSTFTTDKSGSYERQTSAISDITFSWTLNKTPATGDVLQIRTGTNGGTSGDLVYDIIANEPSSNWKSGTYNYSSFTTTNTNKSFHIYYKDNHSVVPSGKSSSTNANTSITFYIKKYYGASALEEPTATQIKALKSVTSSRTLVEEEFNFGDGKYWYYCIPKETDSGAALKFSIGAKGAESPQSGNYFIYEMNDFTNAQGYTVPLRIYKFKKTPAGLPDKITGSSYVKVD